MRVEASIPVLLTAKEAASRLALSVGAVYALCNAGQLNHFRVGVDKGRIRIPVEAIDAYLARSQEVSARVVALPTRRLRQPVSTGFSAIRAAGWSGSSKRSS